MQPIRIDGQDRRRPVVKTKGQRRLARIAAYVEEQALLLRKNGKDLKFRIMRASEHKVPDQHFGRA